MRRLNPAAAIAAAFVAVALFAMAGGAATDLPAADRPVMLAADTTGEAIFKGKGLCHVCHGADAKGTPLAPNLTDDEWLHTDGSVEGIIEIITNGVPQPKEYPAAMPPLGGADLSEDEVAEVAEYVKSLGEGGGG